MLFSYFHLEIRLTWTSRFGHGGKLESSRVAVSAGPVPARCWPLRANIGPAPSGRCRLPGFNNLQLVTFHMSVVANIRWTYHCGCFCVACMNKMIKLQTIGSRLTGSSDMQFIQIEVVARDAATLIWVTEVKVGHLDRFSMGMMEDFESICVFIWLKSGIIKLKYHKNMATKIRWIFGNINGLMQEIRNSCALAILLRHSCINPLIHTLNMTIMPLILNIQCI